jgi:hypothetical protein
MHVEQRFLVSEELIWIILQDWHMLGLVNYKWIELVGAQAHVTH